MYACLFCTIIMCEFSCKPKASNKNSQTLNSEVSDEKFRVWLKDTLSKLSRAKVTAQSQTIDVSQDSLYVEICKSYSTIINRDYQGNELALHYALDLLARNNSLPKGNFELQLTIANYYTKSMVEQLIYDFDSEIKSFNVKQKDSLVKFRFLKGNLVDKMSEANY